MFQSPIGAAFNPKCRPDGALEVQSLVFFYQNNSPTGFSTPNLHFE